MRQELVHGHHAARAVVIVLVVAAHQKEIGGGQDGQRHARAGEPFGHGLELVHRQARCPGDMADGDTAPVLVLIGAAADVIHVHALGGRAEIEMHVDIGVELARHLEHAIDLAGRIGVGVRCCSHHATPAFETREHQLVGAGIVEQTLLREDADLEVDRPGIFLDERQDTFEAAQPDHRVHFQVGAHVRGALQDRLLEGAAGALVDVVRRESGLRLGHLADRLFKIAAIGGAAVENAGFIEVDMRLDEARRNEPAAELDCFARRRQVRPDSNDPAVLDSDVGHIAAAVGQPRVPENEIHGAFLSSTAPANLRVSRAQLQK